MLTLLLRLGPLLAGLGIYGVFEWQWSNPLSFPWPAVVAVAIYGLVAWRVAWAREDRWEVLWKTLPGGLFVAAGGVCSVMLEQQAWREGLSVLVAVGAYMSLELLFLLKYDAPHYPVNGLTHLHVGLVPLTNALLAWGVSGVRAFSRASAPLWLVLAVFVAADALGFATTSHPDATRSQRRAWTVFGAAIGGGIGLLVFFLPLGMASQAFMAALLAAAPLRLRRYGFSPKPAPVVAWLEGIAVSIAFLALVFLSRWA